MTVLSVNITSVTVTVTVTVRRSGEILYLFSKNYFLKLTLGLVSSYPFMHT